MKLRAFVAFLGAVLTGCKPDLPVDPGIPPGMRFLQITGDWVYSAQDVRLAGSSSPGPCEISGVMLRLVQIPRAGAFSGRSTGGMMTCTGSLAFLSGPLPDYPIGKGYTFNQYVSFDFGTSDWRHDGIVTTGDSVAIDSMGGHFKLRNGGIEFQGQFSAVRRSRP